MKFLCVPFGFFLILPTPALDGQSDDARVIVRGHVFDVDGKPVAGARVIPFPLEIGFSGPLLFSTTNEGGYYRLALPAFGSTRICASKPIDGYPDTMSAVLLSGAEKEPVVDLKPGTEFSNVDIHLPPPDGTLNIVVTDSASKNPVASARITLRRNDDATIDYATGVMASGRFQVSLPPRAIQIEISAPGYKTWKYADQNSGEPFIKLESGEHRTIPVALQQKEGSGEQRNSQPT